MSYCLLLKNLIMFMLHESEECATEVLGRPSGKDV